MLYSLGAHGIAFLLATPTGFTAFKGTSKRERIHNVIVPIEVVIIVAERKFDSTNPLLTRTTPKPKKKAPKRASNPDSNATYLH